jgi:hypothetical protein
MSNIDFIGLWLHILGLTAYGGSTLALVAVIVPASTALRPEARHSFLAESLRYYDPLAVGTLGVTFMTGAFNLTRFKDALRQNFFEELGWLLTWKLSFSFVVIIIGLYVVFGLGHRIVRAEMSGEPFEPEKLAAMSRRIVYAGVLNLVLLGMTAWLGLEFGHSRG